ncbi:carbon-nitrogen hydrolase family protein [Liquorilactobacillus sicerae]|uniref:carbon-nitrogen hydrolase family protein n=1 Tax=Liquorilactobacillus sicerae TaxID=1416943 RepID=UPI002480634E|nr:carbon-nitrogen hydrolase family protein [Liquorilactobacillus sicerae]
MKFKIALAQAPSTENYLENLKTARDYATRAQQAGAQLVVFPELYMSALTTKVDLATTLKYSQPLNGSFVNGMRELADDLQLWIIFGMRQAPNDSKDQRVKNAVIVVDNDGQIRGTYYKTHLYDAFGAKESLTVAPGKHLFKPIETPFGKIGLFVCYELRFPEIARYQALHDADLIIVPASWYRGSLKEHHWQTLLTARALENTVYVAGCNLPAVDKCVGDSLVVDPFGVPIARAGADPNLVVTEIDLKRIKEVRQRVPSAKQRQPKLY